MRITVDVLVGNTTARAFYESAGFQPYALELEITAQERARTDTSKRGSAD